MLLSFASVEDVSIVAPRPVSCLCPFCPAVVGGLGEGGMLVGLAVLCLLCALRVVVDVLRFVQHASQDPQDTVAIITHYVFKVSQLS